MGKDKAVLFLRHSVYGR